MRDSLGFPGNLETSGVADGLMCVPVARDEAPSRSTLKMIPGESREIANSLISSFNSASLTDYDSIGSVVELGQQTTAHILRVRDEYVAGLEEIREFWLKAEAQGTITPELSTRLFKLREEVRANARRKSQVSAWLYDVIDKNRGKPEKHAKLLEKLSDGRHIEVAQSSFKHSQGWTKGIAISEKTFRAINRLNNLATVASISVPAAQVYYAKSPAEEMTALKSLYKATGAASLGFGGSALGAFMCVSFGLSTAGFGFLTCGVLVGGLGFVGGEIGEVAGEKVFSVAGTENLKLVRQLKSAPTRPSIDQ